MKKPELEVGNLKTDEAEWSEEMYKIYGQSKETFYPSRKNVMSVILREDLKTFRQNMALLYTDEIFYPFEFRIKRPSGEIRHLTLMSAEKSPENIIFGLIKDITEKKQLEKEKEKSLFGAGDVVVLKLVFPEEESFTILNSIDST